MRVGRLQGGLWGTSVMKSVFLSTTAEVIKGRTWGGSKGSRGIAGACRRPVRGAFWQHQANFSLDQSCEWTSWVATEHTRELFLFLHMSERSRWIVVYPDLTRCHPLCSEQ